jgi:hypothetical protein
MTSLDDIIARKRPTELKVVIALTPEVGYRLAEAQQKVEGARRAQLLIKSDEAELSLAEAEAELEAVKEEVMEDCAEFVFHSIGRQAFEDLRDAHVPTPKQKDKAKKLATQLGLGTRGGQIGWNVETFPPALISACCVSPEMEFEEATELWNSEVFNEAETGQLFQAALQVNQSAGSV